MARLTGWETALAVVTACETSWVKAAEMGRGPPYQKADKVVMMEDLSYRGRKVDAMLLSINASERRLKAGSTHRVHYALGVMGIDEDLESLDLKE
jgi:hypothetical protein